jgi:hypothetical protein
MYSDLALYTDGKWLNGEGRKGEDVINPATGKIWLVCRMRVKRISTLRWRSRKGFAAWKATRPATGRRAQGCRLLVERFHPAAR